MQVRERSICSVSAFNIEAGHVDSDWPEFTFVFTYNISCLNRLALLAISLNQSLLAIEFSLLLV
jgi:hypothetical protein